MKLASNANRRNSSLFEEYPVFSADGQKISYVAGQRWTGAKRYDVWVMDRDGSNKVNITADLVTGVGVPCETAWSPDGSMIALAGAELVVVDVALVSPRSAVVGGVARSVGSGAVGDGDLSNQPRMNAPATKPTTPISRHQRPSPSSGRGGRNSGSIVT